MAETKIAILGCGWLGFSLAKKLLSTGYIINGSTTTNSKLSSLKLEGINPFLINLNSSDSNLDTFLANCSVLIITIPPSNKENSTNSYVANNKKIMEIAILQKVKKIVFISSTSVYGRCNGLINEDTIALPNTQNGINILNCEMVWNNCKFLQTTILRLGGLVGIDRNPIYFLSGRKEIEKPETMVNLVHIEDVIVNIQKILFRDKWGELFNIVAPLNFTKKEYYCKKAREYNLPPPMFNIKDLRKDKIVSGEKIAKTIGTEYNLNLY